MKVSTENTSPCHNWFFSINNWQLTRFLLSLAFTFTRIHWSSTFALKKLCLMTISPDLMIFCVLKYEAQTIIEAQIVCCEGSFLGAFASNIGHSECRGSQDLPHILPSFLGILKCGVTKYTKPDKKLVGWNWLFSWHVHENKKKYCLLLTEIYRVFIDVYTTS